MRDCHEDKTTYAGIQHTIEDAQGILVPFLFEELEWIKQTWS